MTDRLKHDDDLNLNIGEPDEEKKVKKPLGLKPILIGLLVVLILGGAGATWLFLGKTKAHESETVEKPVEKKIRKSVKTIFFGDIIKLGTFEVQLGDMGGELSFKVGIELDVDSPTLNQEITRRSIQIESTVKALLGNKTYDEIQGVDGKIILKNELIATLNRMLETGKVRNVYFSEFLIF